MFAIKNNFRLHQRRHGLSVIEVLTSIVVAMIGVFGVMVMIPFSVKQSQAGLDRDATTSVGRNALAQFQIAGGQIVSSNATGQRFLNWTTDGGASQLSPDQTAGNVGIICIDPLGETESAIAPATRSFPFNAVTPAVTPLPPELLIPTANLVGPGGAFSVSEARRVFRTTDDLVFGESGADAGEDEQLNGPNQIFDVGAGFKRQSNGRVSWCGIAVPTKDPIDDTVGTQVQRYRFFVVIFKGRETDDSPANVDSQMATSLVVRQGYTAGDPDVVTPLSTFLIEAPVSGGAIAKDDWVMITNRKDPTVAPVEDGFEQQVAFARVVSYTDVGTGAPSAANPRGMLTVDGPDFVFKQGGIPPAEDFGPTHIVHLKNVVAVYETSFTLEQQSTWNISF